MPQHLQDQKKESIFKKIEKALDVAKRQGIVAAWGLATKGISTSKVKPEFYKSKKVREYTVEQKKFIKEFDDLSHSVYSKGGVEGYNKWQKSPTAKSLYERAHVYPKYKFNYDTKVYDDDMYDWSSLGRTDRAKVPGGLGEGVFMPTRPGSVKYSGTSFDYNDFSNEYVPLSEDIEGSWLTPDKNGGLVMTSDEQEGSIDRFRKIWSEGESLEDAFSGESVYNLLLEDELGDVSIIKGTDYNLMGQDRLNIAEFKRMGKSTQNEAVLNLLDEMKPKNIYYMDAGRNQAFYGTKGQGFEEGDWAPYSSTITMMGKWRGSN